MALRAISTSPESSSYTPVSEHQGQTPGTFFGEKPVLYHSCSGAEVLIAHDELDLHPAVKNLAKTSSNGAALNREDAASKVVIGEVDVWVDSENLILYSSSSKSGVSIPYPSIALHALQTLPGESANAPGREALLMHISINDTSLANADEDYVMLEMSIIPPPFDPSAPVPEVEAPSTSARGGSNSRTPTRILFNAVSACADLHPDPQSDDDEEEDTAPGAGGWITSENADQYLDEDGQFVGQQFLGPGAGTVRTRESNEDHDADDKAENEVPTADGESKWRRTS